MRKANWMLQSLTGTEEDSLKAEQAVGRDLAQAYCQENAVDPDPKVQEFLDGISSRLIECVADPNNKFTFRTVQTPEYNAHALPGGYIFVMRPLLDLCEWNENEVAFILAHEMGHVLRRHAINRLMANTFVQGAFLRFPLGGLLGAGILHVATDLLNQGYSREQELEADDMAIKLVDYAGYNPAASVVMLGRFNQFSTEGDNVSAYFSSHPPVKVRQEHLQKYLQKR